MSHARLKLVLSNSWSRNQLADWLRDEYGSRDAREIADQLKRPTGKLTDDQGRELIRIVGTEQADEFLRGLWKSRFVAREPDDDVEQYLSRMPFDLKEIASGRDLALGSGERITIGAVKGWGKPTGSAARPAREPHLIESAFGVWNLLDRKAITLGHRVDPWDFLASIYPDISRMLKQARDNDDVIEVVSPWFMGNIPFGKHGYDTFARELMKRGFGTEERSGHGVKGKTRGAHARGRISRPNLDTLRDYAAGIASDVRADEDFAAGVFDYTMVLRVMPVISRTAPDGATVGLVPAEDIEGRSLFSRRDNAVETRYRLRIIPGDPLVVHAPKLRLGRRSLWPESGLADGEFDLKLELVEHRLDSFGLIPGLVLTRDDGEQLNVPELKARWAGFKEKHAEYLAHFRNREAPPLTQSEQSKRRTFYRKLNRFSQMVLRYTHARGQILAKGMVIPFEIVPRLKGVEIDRLVGNRITIFGSDISAVSKKEDWNQSRINALVTLRVILTNIQETHDVGELPRDRGELRDLAKPYWPTKLNQHLDRAVADFIRLDFDSKPLNREEATLHRAVAKGGEREHREYYVHVSHLMWSDVASEGKPDWQVLLAQMYERWGHSVETANRDTEAAEYYFKRIRHPHYIFDSKELDGSIARQYDTEEARGKSRTRLMEFFEEINIWTTPMPRRELEAQRGQAEKQLVLWAFEDYMRDFGALFHMGVKIPMVDDLIDEVVDRIVSEAKGGRARRADIRDGLVRLIDEYNTQHPQKVSQRLSEYPYPPTGLLVRRFDRFGENWKSSHGRLPAPRDALLMAGRMFGPKLARRNPVGRDEIELTLEGSGFFDKVSNKDEAIDFFNEWIRSEQSDLRLLLGLIQHSSMGIATFARRHYRAHMVADGDLERMARSIVVGRFTASASEDLMQEAQDILGQRFNPYPEVREEVTTFLVVAVSHYFNGLRNIAAKTYDQLVTLFDALGSSIASDSPDAFVNALADAARSSGPLRGHRVPRTYQGMFDRERLTAVAGELMGDPYETTLTTKINHAVELNKTQDERRVAERRNAIEIELDEMGSTVNEFKNEVEGMKTNFASLSSRDIRSLSDGQFIVLQSDLSHTIDLIDRGLDRCADEVEQLTPRLMEISSSLSDSRASELVERVRGFADRLIDLKLKVEQKQDEIRTEQNRRAELAKLGNLDARVQNLLGKADSISSEVDSILESARSIAAGAGDLIVELGRIGSWYGTPDEYAEAWATFGKLVLRSEDLEPAVVREALRLSGALDSLTAVIAEFDQIGDLDKNPRFLAGIDSVVSRRNEVQRIKETFDSLDLESRVRSALDKLNVAERHLPLPEKVNNLPEPEVSPSRSKVMRRGLQIEFDKRVRVQGGRMKQVSRGLRDLAASLTIVADSDQALLTSMTKEQREEFENWRAGLRDRSFEFEGGGALDGFRVGAGDRPIRAMQLSQTSRYGPKQLVGKLMSLSRKRTGVTDFMWSVIEARRGGDENANHMLRQLFSNLADRRNRDMSAEDIVRGVAVAMDRHIDEMGFGNLLLKNAVPIELELPDSIAASIKKQDAVEIHSRICPNIQPLIDDLGMEDDTLLASISREISAKAKKNTELFFTALAEFAAGEDADMEATLKRSGIMVFTFDTFSPAYCGTRTIWKHLHAMKKEGLPIADALIKKYYRGLMDTMFPKNLKASKRVWEIDPDKVARYCLTFLEKFEPDILNPWTIRKENGSLKYTPEDHRMDAPFVADFMSYVGDDEKQLKRIIERVMSNHKYLVGGFVLSEVFGEDARYQNLRGTVLRRAREFAGYSKLPDGGRLSFYDEASLGSFVKQMNELYESNLVDGGLLIPPWWQVEPDEDLGRLAPETAAVRSTSIGALLSDVKPDDPVIDVLRGWSMADEPKVFITKFPELAGAVSLVEFVDFHDEDFDKSPFNELYGRAMPREKGDELSDEQRDRLAGEFRVKYMQSRDALTNVLDGSTEIKTFMTHLGGAVAWTPRYTWANVI